MRGLLRRRVLALVVLLVAGAAQAGGPLDLHQAVNRALAANPALQALEAQARAAGERVPQAGALPDPMVNFGAANLPIDGFDLTQSPMTQLQVGVSQRLPFPGKLALRERIAHHRAEAVARQVDAQRLELRAQVIRAWWAVFATDRALEAIRRSEDLVARLIEVARTRYQVGKGTQGDVLLAQLERERLADRRLALVARRGAQASELLRLMAEEGETVALPDAAPPLPDPQTLTLPALMRTAQVHNPQLAAARARVRAAEARVDLAKKDYRPDFTASAAYGWRDDRTDLYSLRLGVSLPIYTARKQDPQLAEARARLAEERARLADLEDRIRARLQAALADYRSAHAQVTLYRDRILPQAQQTVESTLSSYQVGKAGFTNVIRAEVTLDEYDSRRWQAYGDAWQTLAAIEAQIGKELNHERP